MSQTDRNFDRFERFKAKMSDECAYRNAYFAAKSANPTSVDGLPDPDSSQAFDAADALRRLRAGVDVSA